MLKVFRNCHLSLWIMFGVDYLKDFMQPIRDTLLYGRSTCLSLTSGTDLDLIALSNNFLKQAQNYLSWVNTRIINANAFHELILLICLDFAASCQQSLRLSADDLESVDY